METIFINRENGKTNETKSFRYNFTNKLNLKNPNTNIAVANLSIYYTWKKVRSEYRNNKFKIHPPTYSETFDLPDRNYLISEIQDYFEFIVKTDETIIDENSPIKIYVNKVKNKIVFKK